MSDAEKEYPLPFYAGRYVLDTGDLLPLHHGCYLMLILHYWKNGPLPARLGEMAIICKMQPAEFADIAWPKLKRFFKLSACRTKLHNKRLDIERAKRDTPKPAKEKKPRPIRVTADGPEFDAFWHAYPLKAARGAAVKAFVSASKRALVADIMAGLARFARNLPSDKQFIPHASTWLNQDRWMDEPTPRAGVPAVCAPPRRADGLTPQQVRELGL